MKNLTKLFLIFLFSGTFTGFAKTLSPEEAISRIDVVPGNVFTRSTDKSLVLKYTLKDDEAQPSLYVFDKDGSEGFIVLSADDAALPVLGYSDTGTFSPDSVPPQLQYWLKEYSNQIAYMRTHAYPAVESRSNSSFTDLQAIAPMVKSKWNQGAPYNDYCFTIAADGTETKSVTGCVATSMAQVMYYYKYPSVGHGSISYKHGDSGTYSMDFSSKAFNWDEMLPTYYPHSYTEEQADAVAYLMKACGYSVRMDYGKGESGASGTAIAGALIDYFGYSNAIQVQTRDFYTYNDWVNMIYNNLKEVGPLVYNGSALDGGHSFVCDGYDGNGYFHFNWGWGGMSDGYYLLDALNPDEFGIGGAAGGYNLGQQVILNISPKNLTSSTSQLMQFGNLQGKISDKNILSVELKDADNPGFQYINPSTVTVTFGIEVINMDNPDQDIQYFTSTKKNLEAKQGSFFRWEEDGTSLDLTKVNMKDGDEYHFIIATEINDGETTEWSQVVAMPGKANYVSIVKNGTTYELKNNASGNISVSNFKIESSPVYYEKPVKFSADFTNSYPDQLTRNYSAVFFNSEGEECFKMENYSINVDAGEKVNDTWTSVNWYKEKGAADITEPTEFTVKLFDNWQGDYVEGVEQTVTVQPTPGDAKVESELKILDATKEGEVYIVQGNRLDVSLSVKVLEGFFNHTIMLAIQAPAADGSYFTIMHKHFDAIPDLSAGEEQEFEMSVVFDDAEPGKIYRVEIWGQGAGFNEKSLVKFDLQNDGIETIKSDKDGYYTIYNLNGTLIEKSSDITSLNRLPHGIYIVNGKKIAL